MFKTKPIVSKNNKWFSRKGAFSYLELDLESKIRLKKVVSIFDELFSNSKNKKLLDIGCADGQVSQKFIDIGYEVYGIDNSKKLLSKAKKKGVKIKNSDVSKKLPYKDNFFDYVFAGEIIEHLVDTELIIKEINRVLKVNGFFVLTTPNLVHLPERLVFLKGNTPGQVQPLHSFLKFHIRQFTHSSWKKILHKFKFEVYGNSSTIVVFKRDPNDINKVLSYSKLLADIFPSLGASIIIISKKNSNL